MQTEQTITMQCVGVLDAMEQKATQMKDDVSQIWWDEYDEKKYVFDRLRSSACYWAPEIIRNKFWKELFTICTIHFNNASNPIHRELFEIYQERINAEKTK
jgi:hypothetical protein